MENSKILAEAVLREPFESWASCSDNSVQYCCRYCSNGATREPDRYEHDSECPVIVAKRVLEEV